SRRDSFRDWSVRFEISNCRSDARNWKYAAATLATRVETTSWRAHSVERRFARAASVARRNLPQKSSSQMADAFTWPVLVSNAGRNVAWAVRLSAIAAPPFNVGNWSAR